jgi:hypothetical protein
MQNFDLRHVSKRRSSFWKHLMLESFRKMLIRPKQILGEKFNGEKNPGQKSFNQSTVSQKH